MANDFRKKGNVFYNGINGESVVSDLDTKQKMIDSSFVDPEKEYDKPEIKKDYILFVVSDLVADFVYHDRKEDSELDVNGIKQAIDDKIISVDGIVEAFKKNLIESL